MALGFAATCSPAGASSWSDAYAETLWRLGATEVVILADNDQPGRRHAERVGASCHGLQAFQGDDLEFPHKWISGAVTDAETAPLKVKAVHLPDVPTGGDVVDYLQLHSVDDLRVLIAATPYWLPRSR